MLPGKHSSGCRPAASTGWNLRFETTINRFISEKKCFCGRSFDVIRDGLGGPRSTFPHDVMLAAGTQAATARANYIALLRLCNLGQVSRMLI